MSLDDPSGWIGIASSHLRAYIDPLGAQLAVLRDAQDHELLWNGDPAWWNGRAPVLFPIVGALAGGRFCWQDREYALPRHGFARGSAFTVERRSPTSAVFVLRSDEGSRRVYPFDFELRLSFEADGPELRVIASVRNTGSGPLPASIGFHPAFRWPIDGSARAGHWIEFELPEPEPIRRLDAAGLLRAERLPTPVRERRLDLDDTLFVDDVVIFDQLHSQSLSYGNAHTRLTIAFPDATHLGLWTKPGAGFLCIEPWRGVADPVGGPADLGGKPGIVHVAAGDEARLSMTVRVD